MGYLQQLLSCIRLHSLHIKCPELLVRYIFRVRARKIKKGGKPAVFFRVRMRPNAHAHTKKYGWLARLYRRELESVHINAYTLACSSSITTANHAGRWGALGQRSIDSVHSPSAALALMRTEKSRNASLLPLPPLMSALMSACS